MERVASSGKIGPVAIAALVGLAMVSIASTASASSLPAPQKNFSRCDENSYVDVHSFKVDPCEPGPSGNCLLRRGQKLKLKVQFTPQQTVDSLVSELNLKKESDWSMVKSGSACEEGLKCPCEPGSMQTLENEILVWTEEGRDTVDYRLALNRFYGRTYMCLDFKLDVDHTIDPSWTLPPNL